MHTQSILSARFMFIPLSFLAFALFPLASTSPIGTGDPAPCVSTQGWTSQWIADGQKNGVTFCGDSSADDGEQGSTTPSTSESSSPSSTASSNLDYPNTSTTPKSSTSSGALPHSVSSSADSGTNTTGTDTSGSGSGTGDKSGRRKKPCIKPKGTSSGGDFTPVVGAGTGSGSGSGSGAGTGAGMGAGTGTDVISSSTTTSSALSSSSTLASSGSSSVSVQGQATDGPGAVLGAGSAPTLTLQNGDNNTASSSASQPASATAGDGKTYQATITRYTDNCANQVGACGFLEPKLHSSAPCLSFGHHQECPANVERAGRSSTARWRTETAQWQTQNQRHCRYGHQYMCVLLRGSHRLLQPDEGQAQRSMGSVVGVDLCKDTGASAALWGAAQDDQGGIAVATIQQVDCDQHWQGDLSPKTFTDWTKYQASAGKSLKMKPGTHGKRRRWW